MTPAALQDHIANAIRIAQASYFSPLHICYFERDIKVLPRAHTHILHPIIWNITPLQLDSGFSTAEWNEVSIKALQILKGVKKCPRPCQPLPPPNKTAS